MDDRDREMMIETIIGNRGEPLPDNPPPGPKWKAVLGLNRLQHLNGAEHAVMACLIDRANPRTGLCFPSEAYIAGWINRPERTVRRAISVLKRMRLARIIRRGPSSNRYVINWLPLFVAYRELEEFQAARRDKKWPVIAAKSGRSSIPKVAAKSSNREPLNRNLKHEMVIAHSGADLCASRHGHTELEGQSLEPDKPEPFPKLPDFLRRARA